MAKTTIEVTDETWTQLNRRKERGETFDDVINDMMSADIKLADPENEPQVVDWEEADGDEACANFVPDRGGCDEDADYVLTLTTASGDNESEVPFCEEHANLPEDEVKA